MSMLRLMKLSSYFRKTRMNARRAEVEVEALDITEDNKLIPIHIHDNGYIVKLGEVYIGEVNRDIAEDDYPVSELLELGADVVKLGGRRFRLTVSRPLRIYDGMPIFDKLNSETNEQKHESIRHSHTDKETPQ